MTSRGGNHLEQDGSKTAVKLQKSQLYKTICCFSFVTLLCVGGIVVVLFLPQIQELIANYNTKNIDCSRVSDENLVLIRSNL